MITTSPPRPVSTPPTEVAIRNPPSLVAGDAAAGNDAMEVWMMMKVLSPGMQHRQKTDPGAEVPWIGGDLQQGFGGGMEEKAID